MTICHYSSLQFLGTFHHKNGEIHKRYQCQECGECHQWSPSSGWYQIRKRNNDPRIVISFRKTRAQKADMIADAGSVQGWVDKYYRLMKSR